MLDKILATITAITIGFNPVASNSSIQEVYDEDNSDHIVNHLKNMEDQVEYLSDSEIVDLKDEFNLSFEEYNLNIDRSFLSFDKAKGTYIEELKSKVLTIPVVADDYHEISSVSIFFNNDLEVEVVSETFIYKNNEGNFSVEMYQNNELYQEFHSDEPFIKKRH